jgi:hypothetical protein
MPRPKGAKDRTPRRRRADISRAASTRADHGDVPATISRETRIARNYERARQLVEAIRQLPPAILNAQPGRWRRGRWGMPALTPRLLEALKGWSVSTNLIGDHWRYIAMVERFPMLAPPVGQIRVLAIERVLALSPAADHEQLVSSLRTASARQLQRAYQAARRQRRPLTRRRARSPQRRDLSPGALWYKRIVEVRQHLLSLKQEDLVENLAKTWTPQNLDGYLKELDHVIEELVSVKQRMHGVSRERTKLRLVHGRPETDEAP